MFQLDTSGRTWGHSFKLMKCWCNKDVRKYFFSHRVISKWNMMDDDTVTARTVNGFKSKLEKERTKKMGLFMDWCRLDPEAVTVIRSGHPASILQVCENISSVIVNIIAIVLLASPHASVKYSIWHFVALTIFLKHLFQGTSTLF